MLIKLFAKDVPPTSRRCTLNRTYRERNSAVCCGTVQCTFPCSLLRRIYRIPCFIMKNEVIIRCQKTPEVGIWRTVYPRVRLYTPIGTNQKFGGAWARFGGGPVPPGPSLKPPLIRPVCEPKNKQEMKTSTFRIYGRRYRWQMYFLR